MASPKRLELLGGSTHVEPSGPDIIFIHGLTGAHPNPDGTGSWQSVVSNLAPENSNILSFDLGVRLDETGGWQLLSTRVGDLLEALCDFHKTAEANRRPIIFLCHSLSGWALKQMLWRAKQQFTRFRDIIELVSGIVFLATPHFKNSSDESGKLLSLVLRTDLMTNPKKAFSKSDLSALAYNSWQFEELKLNIPIMSCYETVATKLRSQFWFSRKAVLVPDSLAKTSAQEESLAAIDIELSKFFDLADSVIHLRISDFLASTSSAAVQRIEQVFKAERKTGRIPASSLRSKTSMVDSDLVVIQSSNRPGTSPMNLSSSASPRRDSANATNPLSGSPHDSLKSNFSYEVVGSKPPRKINLPFYYTRPHTSRNPDFRGRSEELQLIHNALSPDQSGSQDVGTKQLKTFVLHGLGGIGKTQLAVEYIFSKRDSYDAIFWLQADQPDKLSAGFGRIAVELGLESKESADDQVASREIVKAWLSNPLKSLAPSPSGDSLTKHARWLIVFDNADKPEALLDGGFWPRDGQGSVLVTSRDPMSKSEMFFGNAGIELTALKQSDAATLLRTLSLQEGRESSEQLSVDVVQKLNCYPLAIVQMAGIIRRRSLSLAEFLEIYCQEEERTELHELRVGTLHGYGLTLSSVWAFDSFTPGARQILSVIALLDPDSIAEEILTTAPQDAMTGFPQTKPAFFRDLSILAQSSIIHRNTDQNELSVHRMVQDVIRSQLLKTDDLVCSVFQVTVRLLSSVWPFVTTPRKGHTTFDQVDRWTQCERMIPHIVRLRQIFEDFDDSKQRGTATVDFAWLLAEGAWYHLERSNPRECLGFIETGFKLTDVSPEDLSFIRAEFHGTRSSIGLEMNEKETALYHREQNVAFREATFAKDGKLNNKLAAGYSEYGRALMTCGLFGRAAEMFEKSISIREQLPGFTRLQLFNPLRGLALVRWHEGSYEEASELLLGALRDRELAFGRDDKESCRTGELLYSLGSVRQSQGLLEESFVYHQRALLQFRSSIGDNHHLTAKACYNLSMHYLRFGDYERTLALLEQASRVFSRDHYYAPQLARVTFMIGQVLILQGNTRAGGDALKRAWNMRQRLVPEDLRPVGELQIGDFDELVEFWAV
ncbi:hypothetical protein QBC47DRAFT_395340 [Echria macrotheca]|uniref:NB-ARC domain-containing protein n=1 Tax=Echria macrotheca TaxID=438768 RepID=A0AAJ0B168_9PEZI|nr:hypothetical protein QBC47DRAFT_395340 [Echria macrotheca]